MKTRYVARKFLRDGCLLKITTWTSDTVSPGKAHVPDLLIIENPTEEHLRISRFPTNYQDYTESQVREMYSDIKSREDFRSLRSQARHKK